MSESTAFDADVKHWVVHDRSDKDTRSLQEFRRILESSLWKRLGIRRVGVLLSSGVDSAALMAGSNQVNPGNVKAFTVGFDSIELDESNSARAMANVLGVPHTILRFSYADYREAFALMMSEFEQPFGDPSNLPLICAARAIRQDVDLLCDGSGSDGSFGAPIPRHLRFSLTYPAKWSIPVRQSFAAILNNLNSVKLRSFGSLFEFDDPEELLITWPGWSKRDLQAIVDDGVSFDDSGFYKVFRAHKSASVQEQFDAVGFFPPDDGRFEAAEIAGIPITLPFHDGDLATFIRHQPLSARFNEGGTKVLLRQLFARYFPGYDQIPSKRYFTFPLYDFVANENYTLVRRLLSRDRLIRHALFDPDRLIPWIDRFVAGDRSLLFKMWSLLILHGWLESND
jgi:asparagine synthase (glutamine-hydrolysing)